MSDPFWVSEILTSISYNSGEMGLDGGCHASLFMLKTNMSMNREMEFVLPVKLEKCG